MAVRSLFAKPVLPNPETATAEDRRRFVTQYTRLYTRDLALEFMLRGGGTANHLIVAEAFEAIEGFGEQCGMPLPDIIHLVHAEWAAATGYAERFLNDLRRRLWPLCRSRMPQAVIVDEFDAVCMAWGTGVPPDLAPPLIVSIWRAAQVRRRGGFQRPPPIEDYQPVEQSGEAPRV